MEDDEGSSLVEAREIELHLSECVPSYLAPEHVGKLLEAVIARRLSYYAGKCRLLPGHTIGWSTRPQHQASPAGLGQLDRPVETIPSDSLLFTGPGWRNTEERYGRPFVVPLCGGNDHRYHLPADKEEDKEYVPCHVGLATWRGASIWQGGSRYQRVVRWRTRSCHLSTPDSCTKLSCDPFAPHKTLTTHLLLYYLARSLLQQNTTLHSVLRLSFLKHFHVYLDAMLCSFKSDSKCCPRADTVGNRLVP